MKTRGGGLHGGEKIAAVLRVFVVDAVGNDFGIGLRFKGVAQALQAFALGFKVFDDAVVHHGDVAAGDVGVGIRLGYAAVGCPARVADAGVAEQPFFTRRVFHQLHAADAAHALDFAFGVNGNARGVVTPVFEAFEAVC